VALKFDHSEDKRSIPLGIIKNAVVDSNNESFVDYIITTPAIADLDGEGPKVLLTIEQIVNAVKSGAMKASIEAYRNVVSAAYYGDRKISLEISAVAVLPVGVLPAVPRQRIAAGQLDKGELVVLSIQKAQHGAELSGEDNTMTLDEALALIEDLKAQIADLQEEIDTLNGDVPGEGTDVEIEAKVEPDEDETEVDTLKGQLAEAEETIAELERDREETKLAIMEQRASELLDKVKNKLIAGRRDSLDEEMAKIESPSEKMAILGHMDRVLPDLEPDGEILDSGEDNTDKSEQLQKVEAAAKLAKENGISFVAAYQKIIERG
jgi:hypothetical protein